MALPLRVLFCFIINHEHNGQIPFIVTRKLFFFICSWFVKKLVVLFNKFFQTVKKRPLALVNFKRGSEDFLKSSLCNWRRPILFILITDVNTKLSVMKPIHARWLVGLYNHLQNKPEVIRKGFEMAGIVEAVTRELEPEDPFEDLVADYWATLSSKTLSFLFEANSSFLKHCLRLRLDRICVIFSADSVSVKPRRCSQIINFTDVVSVYIHVWEA